MSLTAESTLLVASLAPVSNAEALAARAEVADLPRKVAVELRLDAFAEAPEYSALRACFEGRTLIATVRSKAEGGEFRGSEKEERGFLEGALSAGFDLADVEFRGAARPALSGLPPSRQILSLHDPEGVPPDLERVVSRMLASGARFVKVVATANDSGDARRLLELQAVHRDGRFTAFGMGDAGIATRALSPYFGAALAFGALLPNRATAPGQLLARDLAGIYGVGRRRSVSRLFALFGGMVSHSLSPAVHNANFEASGLDALYVPFAMRALGREIAPLVDSLDALGLPLAGASVTIPFKEEAAILAGAAREGERAVNTLLRASAPGEPLRLRAANTDRVAFEAAIQDEKEREDGVALVVGAGGTARIAVDVLKKHGWEVFISNRTRGRGEDLARETGAHALSEKSGAPRPKVHVIVNATSVGLREGDPLPFEQGLLRPGILVIDAPYREGGTELVRAARAAGARVVDGQTLLLLQAAGQATLFTGSKTSARELLERLPPVVRSAFSAPDSLLDASREVTA